MYLQGSKMFTTEICQRSKDSTQKCTWNLGKKQKTNGCHETLEGHVDQHADGVFFFETHGGLILPSLKLTLHLKMDGWNTSCLLGRPIFRGEMLVSGRVFRWVFDQVSSEHEKILCLKKLEGARFLLLDMLETHRLISPWIEVRTTQPKLPQSAKNHSGSGPRAKGIGFSKDMAPTITSIESLTRKVKD